MIINSKPKKSIFILTAAYVLVLVLILLCFDQYSIQEIKNKLIDAHFYFLEINFFLMLVGFLIMIPVFRKLFQGIPKKIYYIVLGIVFSGIVLTSVVAPQIHRIFYDEDIYENVGQNMATLQKAQFCLDGSTTYGVYHCQNGEYNKEPYGYPYLLSIVYRIFGVNETFSFLLNNLLFGISIAIVFFLTFILFNNYLSGIYAAIIYTLIPQNLIWFNTAAVEPSASLLGALFLLSFVLYIKDSSGKSLFFMVVMAAFSIQFRPESILLLLIALVGIVLYSPSVLKGGRIYRAGLFFSLLSFAYIIHIFATSGGSWGTSEAKFSFNYLAHNFSINTLYYLDNIKFPILFTIFFLLGFVGKPFLKEKIWLALWFLFFWGIFLFFYAGSYGYGADVRYSLVSYVPFAILGGLGVFKFQSILHKFQSISSFMHPIVMVILLLSFLKFLPQVRAETQEAWGARVDHFYAEEFAKLLPENSIVLTHNPTMFHLWGKNAAYISLATESKSYVNQVLFSQYKDGVFLHWNYWCNAADSVQNSYCENVIEDYDYELIKEYHENDFRYTLYRLKLKDSGEIPYYRAIKPKLPVTTTKPVK